MGYEEKLECVDYKNRVSLGGETDIGVTATIAVGLSSRHPMSYRKWDKKSIMMIGLEYTDSSLVYKSIRISEYKNIGISEKYCL